MKNHFSGGERSYASIPEGTKFGLTTGLAHKVHQSVFIGQTKEAEVARRDRFSDQQLVGQVAVL